MSKPRKERGPQIRRFPLISTDVLGLSGNSHRKSSNKGVNSYLPQ